jgi:hypothetical protein
MARRFSSNRSMSGLKVTTPAMVCWHWAGLIFCASYSPLLCGDRSHSFVHDLFGCVSHLAGLRQHGDKWHYSYHEERGAWC